MNNWFIIETEKEYAAAMQRFQEIKYAKKTDNTYREKMLLVHLISNYENSKSTLPELDPIEFIKIRMEDFGYKPADLAKAYGDKGTVSKVLNYKQPLSLNMIRIFSDLLKISPAQLIKAYKLQ